MAFASLCLLAGVVLAEDRHDAVLRALLAGVDSGLDELLLEPPATPGAIADRTETLLARLGALRPPAEPQIAQNVADRIAAASRDALAARPVLPPPATVEPPPGAVRFTRDLTRVEGLRLPLPAGAWRLLLFAESSFGREVAVNRRRQPVAPGAGVLVLEAEAGADGVTVAFPEPRDLTLVVAEPADGPSLMGDALPTEAEVAAAEARIDRALADAVPRRLG